MIDLTHFGLSPVLARGLRHARRSPSGGIWYWYPTPEGWELTGSNLYGPLTSESASDPLAKVFHVQEFEEVVRLMEHAWGLTSLPLTRDVYRGLPRGRVSCDESDTWKLEHGGEFSTRHITRHFGLQGHPVEDSIIEHEMTDARHVEVVEKTLLYKTDDDVRLTHAFTAIRDHQVSPTTGLPVSPSTRVSMKIEADDDNGVPGSAASSYERRKATG